MSLKIGTDRCTNLIIGDFYAFLYPTIICCTSAPFNTF